jgi:hypothetical protein
MPNGHPPKFRQTPVRPWGLVLLVVLLVLTWKQPRAVDAGKRGLGQPARHNASAATGAARGCTVPSSHRQ